MTQSWPWASQIAVKIDPVVTWNNSESVRSEILKVLGLF